MKKTNHILIIAVIAIVVIAGFFYLSTVRQDRLLPEQMMENELDEKMVDEEINEQMMEISPEADEAMIEMDDEMMKDFMTTSFQFTGKLDDVTQGKTVEGVNTQGLATGTASMSFEDGEFSVLATFGNLPEPQGTDFYEGWVVRRSPFKFISTGKAVNESGIFMNMYSSGTDYTDFDFYVLTIEPDDGDPAPAGHILEGTMFPVN